MSRARHTDIVALVTYSYATISHRQETLTGTAMLTTNYPNSNTTSFDLYSFYFGTTLTTANALTNLPMEGLLSITGYQGNDNQVSLSAVPSQSLTIVFGTHSCTYATKHHGTLLFFPFRPV